MAFSDVALGLSPLAYWRLGEASGGGSGTMLDSSPNARNGNYSLTGVTFGQPSLIGDADTSVTFNGTTGYARVPNAVWMNYAAGFSTVIVAEFAQPASYTTFLSSASWLDFYVDSEGWTYVWFKTTTGTRTLIGNRVLFDTPTMFTITHDLATLKLYAGSRLLGSIAATGAPLGGSHWDLATVNLSDYYAVALDENLLFGRALTEAEVAALDAELPEGMGQGLADPITVDVDTFNRANGRTRTGLAEAWVEYDLDDLDPGETGEPGQPGYTGSREPLRIMAQQLPTPTLVNGRPT